MAVGVGAEIQNRAFLRLRPQAFSAHIGANAGENLRAKSPQERNADDDRDKDRDDHQHFPRDRKTSETLCLKLHVKGIFGTASQLAAIGRGEPNYDSTGAAATRSPLTRLQGTREPRVVDQG